MSDPVDESEFSGAAEIANRLRAMGYKRDAKTRIGGIVNPQKIKLSPGDIIFRFGNKSRSLDEDRRGAWWMTQATLMLNAEHAATVDGFINTRRQNLALPPAFSPLDRVFGATVKGRLSAFSGVGSGIWRTELDARDRTDAPPLLLGAMERDGSSRATSLRFQLFIPGLDAVGQDALTYGQVRSAMEWFNLPTGQRQWP